MAAINEAAAPIAITHPTIGMDATEAIPPVTADSALALASAFLAAVKATIAGMADAVAEMMLAE